MTGPTQPRPDPLPNPGPPPAPVACRYPECECARDYPCGDTAPTAGTGPTHPPTRPGTGSPPPPPPPKDQLPSLINLASFVRSTLDAMVHMLGRQWDPRTGPAQQDDPWGPDAVDIHLGSAVADVRSAMREIDAVVALLQPTYPVRQSRACSAGGPSNHPADDQGERLRPGYTEGVCGAPGESAELGISAQDASHLADTWRRVGAVRPASPTARPPPTKAER